MLEGLAPKKKEGLCPLMFNALNTFDDTDMKIFLSALEEPSWSSNGLAEALTERGFKTTETQLRRHRTKSCSCAR